MNNSYVMLRSVHSDTRLMKQESVVEDEEYFLYHLIIRSYMYLVMSIRPNPAYHISDLV
jgi:hypothetical protein